MKNILRLFVLLLAVVLFSTGCGTKSAIEKSIESEIEKSTGQEANLEFDDEKTTIKIGDDMTIEAGEGVSLPEDWPDDVFVIDGTIMAAAQNIAGAGNSITIITEKTVSEAKAIYDQKLAEDNWNITFSSAIEGTVMAMAQKDNRSLSLSITIGDDGQTNVVLTIIEQ